MWIKIIDDGLTNDYESKSKWIASLFIFIGLIFCVYILFSSLSTSAVLGTTLTTVGLISAYLTAKLNPRTIVSWSKSLLIFLTGLVFLFVGMDTLATMGVVVGLFFLFETLNDLYLAYRTRQDTTAYAWGLHALLSAFFALDILLNTSTLQADTIGLYVAVNLISDGLVVLYSGRRIYIRP